MRKFLLIIVMMAFLLEARSALAAGYFNGAYLGASSTLTMTAGSTAKTMLFWGKKDADTAGFLGGFFGGTAYYIFDMDRGGAGVGNNVVCRVNGTAALSGAGARAGVWMGYACTVNTGNTITAYQFNPDLTLYTSGTATYGGTDSSDSLYIGWGAGTSYWRGSIRNFQFFPYAMTQRQIRNALAANSPYRIGTPDYFCPLTSGNDMRCWLNGAKKLLAVVVAGATTVKDPPIGLLPF